VYERRTAYRRYVANYLPSPVDGRVPATRSAAETLALAEMRGTEKRRARRAEHRELLRRVANGTATADEARRVFPTRFAHK
jgi:hypothetical protein